MGDIDERTESIRGGPGAVEVRVFRDGQLLSTEHCETAEEATALAEGWGDEAGIECEIDDLSFRHSGTDIESPEIPEDLGFEDLDAGEPEH